MKNKSILALLMFTAVSGSAIASDGWDNTWAPVDAAGDNVLSSGFADTASATLFFEGSLPLVSGGEYITITGMGGAPLINGTLNIQPDGSFGTKNGIYTEVHKYNADSKEVGPILTSSDATSVAWTLATPPVLTAIASDTTGAEPIMNLNGSAIDVDTPVSGDVDAYNKVLWTVSSNEPMATLVAGDTVTLQSQVDVEVIF